MAKKAAAKKAARVALMGCAKVQTTCPSVICKKAFLKEENKVKHYGESLEVVAHFICPGCPGKKVKNIVGQLVKEMGVNVVHIAACLVWDEFYSRCPHMERIIKDIEKCGVKVVKGNPRQCVRYFRSNDKMYDVVRFLQKAGEGKQRQ